MENIEEINKKVENMTRVNDVEEKLNLLITRRNDLKKSGRLKEDEEVELLLNKAIIMNFLELENIKNEGITLNLLSLLRTELNDSEELNYANKKLKGNHRLLECTPASEVFFAAKDKLSGFVSKDNEMSVKIHNDRYVHSFDEYGLLQMSSYECGINNNSVLFSNMQLKGTCIYSDVRDIHEELYNGYEMLKEFSSSYGSSTKDHIFPSMRGVERDIEVISSIEEISPELVNKIESSYGNVSKSI